MDDDRPFDEDPKKLLGEDEHKFLEGYALELESLPHATSQKMSEPIAEPTSLAVGKSAKKSEFGVHRR